MLALLFVLHLFAFCPAVDTHPTPKAASKALARAVKIVEHAADEARMEHSELTMARLNSAVFDVYRAEVDLMDAMTTIPARIRSWKISLQDKYFEENHLERRVIGDMSVPAGYTTLIEEWVKDPDISVILKAMEESRLMVYPLARFDKVFTPKGPANLTLQDLQQKKYKYAGLLIFRTHDTALTAYARAWDKEQEMQIICHWGEGMNPWELPEFKAFFHTGDEKHGTLCPIIIAIEPPKPVPVSKPDSRISMK